MDDPIKVKTPAFQLSIQRIAYLLIILVILTYVLIVGKDFLVPVVLALFLTFMFKPICDRFERLLRSRVAAIFVTFLVALLPLLGILFFFGVQLLNVYANSQEIADGLLKGLDRMVDNITQFAGFQKSRADAIIADGLEQIVEQPGELITASLLSSTTMLANFFLIIIYVFFFLLYRTAFKRFLLAQMPRKSREEGSLLLYEIQQVVQDYLMGLLFVMLLLGILNSTGLYLIGIEYAFLWGFLGALLAVIPYIGTTLGGLLPFIYAVATTDDFWQPIAVVVLYGTIQALEGNIITPKIVGNKVNINPLTAIFALIIGGYIWGIAGMVIALPLIAMVRIIFAHLKPLKPVALLMSDAIYEDSDRFLNEYDKPEYRLSSLFKLVSQKALLTQLNRSAKRQPPKRIAKSDPQEITEREPE